MSTGSASRHSYQVVSDEISEEMSFDSGHDLLEIQRGDGSVAVLVVLLECLNTLLFVEIVKELAERVVVDVALLVAKKLGISDLKKN